MNETTLQTQTLTAQLSEEHGRILQVIAALRAECDGLQRGTALDRDFFLKAVDFIKQYADRFHHAKEEDILFPAMGEPGVLSHCDPRQVMLHEHELGRQHVRGLESALRQGRTEEILGHARGYAQLLEEHIYKEDNILYPMAEAGLGEKRCAELQERFAQVNREFTAAIQPHLAFVAAAQRRMA